MWISPVTSSPRFTNAPKLVTFLMTPDSVCPAAILRRASFRISSRDRGGPAGLRWPRRAGRRPPAGGTAAVAAGLAGVAAVGCGAAAAPTDVLPAFTRWRYFSGSVPTTSRAQVLHHRESPSRAG